MSPTPDGAGLLVTELTAKMGSDLMWLPITGKGQKTPLVQTPFNERNADVSPDGRWLAYQSDESGRDEIYVRPFPDVNGGRWQISSGGGAKPVWAREGGELFYLDGDGFLTAARVQTAPSFSAGNASRLLDTRYPSGVVNDRDYDVSRDGKRFLMIKTVPVTDQTSPPSPASIVVVVNWSEELKQRVPTK
jgi:dipeptidyl aminopeptidase/acylaminoacyl peptidase